VQLSQLEAFLEVARVGTLGRAARSLGVTQPALTARLHTLEGELGERLFARTRRGMELTEAGRALMPYATRALDALTDGRTLLAELHRGRTGELAVGAAPAVSTYVLPGLLARYAARHPNVRLVVRTGHSEEIVDALVRGDVAVGLVREIQHPLVEATPLYEDELTLVAAPEHRLAGARNVAIERLGDERLILFDRASSYYDLTNALVRGAGVSPRGVMELDTIDAAKQMVLRGLGVALLPASAVATELSAGRLRSVELVGAPPIRRRIVTIRRRDAGPPTPAVAGFLEILGEGVENAASGAAEDHIERD
jgi:DNA-binding transcriptional LysR family regulator